MSALKVKSLRKPRYTKTNYRLQETASVFEKSFPDFWTTFLLSILESAFCPLAVRKLIIVNQSDLQSNLIQVSIKMEQSKDFTS